MSIADTPKEYLQLILALAEPYMNRDGAGLDEDWQEFISVVQKAEISHHKAISTAVREAQENEIYNWFDKKFVDEGSPNMTIGHTMQEVKARLAQLKEEQ